MTMAEFQALLLTIILMLVSVCASDTIQELSFTMGEDAIIPCDFREGTVRNLFWYYNDTQMILNHFKDDLSVKPAYANRADLLKDNLTLVLKYVTVEDEGTYRCVVDRQDQTGVNIYTKLNVFGLSPNSLPVVPQRTEGEKSSCAVNASASFNLTCELRNIYPVKDAKLNWNHDGQYIPTSNDSMGNEDGTFDMIRRIEVAGTGNFTCHATFLSANGTANTAVPVSVCITPDVQNSPGKNLTGGVTAGIVIGCMLPVAVLVIVVIWKNCHSMQTPQPDAQVQQDSTEQSSPVDSTSFPLLPKVAAGQTGSGAPSDLTTVSVAAGQAGSGDPSALTVVSECSTSASTPNDTPSTPPPQAAKRQLAETEGHMENPATTSAAKVDTSNL